MVDKKIAVSHPGKIGDALYCLPSIRYLTQKHGCKADFYTSAYCAALIPLFEMQSCIDRVIIPPSYEIEHGRLGIQPWKMPIPENDYAATYQLGFREVPDNVLPDFIADTAGAPAGLPIEYEIPTGRMLDVPYIVVAPGREPSIHPLFYQICRLCPIKAVVIGAKNEYCGIGMNFTGLDLVRTLGWIRYARAFVGTISSQLVLANAFPIPKVGVSDGVSFDMRHVIKSEQNFYPVYPSPDEVLKLIGLG